MTEIIHLVEATPRNPGVGLVTVRMVSARSHARDTVKNSQSWIPALTSAPVQVIKFLGDDQMPGILEIGYGALGIRFSPDLGNDVWSAYAWEGADATLWRGESGAAFGDFEKIFTGRCGALERQNANIGSIALRGYEGDLDRDLLSSTYAGTSGAEGDLAMKGVSKPWMSGPCEGVPGVLIDKVNWIWQLHGYGAIDDITAAYEGGLTLGSAHATVPTTYAALAALSMGGASWAKAPAVGLVRLGYEPSRPVVFDARGAKDGSTYVSKVGAITSHLLKVAGFESGDINSTSAGNLDTAFAHDWGYYTAMQASIGDVVRKALADIGGYAFPDESGIWRFGRYKAIKTATALKSDRSAAPIVRSISQRASLSPIGRVEVGARRCWGVHREDEISPALLDALDKVDGVEDGATKNAPGQMLRDASYSASEWSLTTGAARRTSSYVSSVWPTSHAVELTCTLAGNVEAVPYSADLGTGLVPLNGASRVWLRAYTRNAAATRSQVWVMNFYDQAGTPIDSVSRIITVSDIPSGAGGWVELRGVVPDGATFVVPKLQVPAGTPGTGVWYTANPLLAFVQPSADVTQEGNAAGLLAGSKILQNGAPAIQAGASPFEYSVTDGDVITFQPPLAVTPKESFNLLGLPALASGESYSARAETLTGSGCTVRIKKRTSGGTISTLSTGAGSVITTDLEYQVSKGDSRDARDFKYNMRLQGDIYGLYQAGGGGGWLDIPFMLGGITIEIFAKVSGSWQSCGVFTVTPPYGSTGTFSFDKTFTFTCANAIGDPSGNEFRALVLSRAFPATDKLTALHSVAWQIDGTSVTETAVTQAVTMRIQPQNV